MPAPRARPPRILRPRPLLSPCIPRPRTLLPLRHLASTCVPANAAADVSTGGFQKAAKQARKALSKSKHSARPARGFGPDVGEEWQVTVGLEVHAQLNTRRKLFSDALTSTTALPNTHIAPFDASLPGTQPRFNPAVLLPALRAALALSCTPSPTSRFDRKHYFYWDQPAGYQITQFYSPLAKHGHITLTPLTDGVARPLTVGIRQVQIEQDTGKTLAAPPHNLVDLNRVGAPLVEIITEPFAVEEPAAAARVLAKIQAVLRAVDACVLGMEWGGLRADVNVSVARAGSHTLGRRCEVKNLSSFKTVQDAVESEARRQVRLLETGAAVEGETRGWDAERSVTRRLRGKEGVVDYRYMPDPDLPPLRIAEGLLREVQSGLPMLPDQVVGELVGEPYGLEPKDARTLLAWDEGRAGREGGMVGYYKEVVALVTASLSSSSSSPSSLSSSSSSSTSSSSTSSSSSTPSPPAARSIGKLAGNWLLHIRSAHLPTPSHPPHPGEASKLADLLTLLLTHSITGATAKSLLPRLLQPGSDTPSVVVDREGLRVAPITEAELDGVVSTVLGTERGRDVLAQIKAGVYEKKEKGLRSWVVGQVVRELEGRVEATRVEEALARALA